MEQGLEPCMFSCAAKVRHARQGLLETILRSGLEGKPRRQPGNLFFLSLSSIPRTHAPSAQPAGRPAHPPLPPPWLTTTHPRKTLVAAGGGGGGRLPPAGPPPLRRAFLRQRGVPWHGARACFRAGAFRRPGRGLLLQPLRSRGGARSRARALHVRTFFFFFFFFFFFS